MTRLRLKLNMFYKFVTGLSELSTCKRAQCGSVIVSSMFSSIRGIGYNGPPSGSSNSSCTNMTGECGCVHAEANALVKLDSLERDLVMITTTQPCPMCAGLIVNCKKIKAVIFGKEYRLDGGTQTLLHGAVEVYNIGDISDAEINRLFRAR